jgi:hypothetical protein
MILRNHKCINEDISIYENEIKIINKYNKTTNNKFLNKTIKNKNIKNKTIKNKTIKNKYVLIQKEPIIKYYFLSQKEKNDKIKAFNIILTNLKYD